MVSVPRVTTFSVAGLELWFNSNDHLPPHFHAEKPGQWSVRVRFLRDSEQMIEILYSFMPRRPSKSDLKALIKLTERHRAALLEEWEAKVNVTNPGAER